MSWKRFWTLAVGHPDGPLVTGGAGRPSDDHVDAVDLVIIADVDLTDEAVAAQLENFAQHLRAGLTFEPPS